MTTKPDELDTNQASEDELRAEILTEFKQVHKLAPADYTENCTNIVMSIIRTEKLKLLAEIGEPKLEDAINEEKTPEGVKSTPKEPNDIFIILSPYFECKDCGELGCPYNPDVPAELAEAIDQYTQSKLKAFAGDIEKAIGEKEVSEYKQFDPNDEMILADLHASLVEARIDELKQLWNSTQPDIVPEGAKANDMSEQLHKRIAELQSTIKTNRSI